MRLGPDLKRVEKDEFQFLDENPSKLVGLASVAVFSESDRGARHVRMADEAHLIGPAPARQSYLDIDKLIAVARRTGRPAHEVARDLHQRALRLVGSEGATQGVTPNKES